MRNRFACLKDLAGYFKKSELFSGLTTLEQEEARRNLGIIDVEGSGGEANPVEVTYAVIWDKIRSKSLVTGVTYAITDFQTIYTSNVLGNGGTYESWGLNINPSQTWTLLVTAISNEQLDRRITIAGKQWEVEYDVKQEILPDGTRTKGKITYLADDNGNIAFYDFKNIRWRYSATVLRAAGLQASIDMDLYTFSEVVNGEVHDSSELHNTKFNVLSEGCYNNIFFGDTYYNILEPECKNNIFAKGAHDCIIKWNTTGNRFNEPVCYLTGSIYNKEFETGDTVLSTAITKTIHKVNEATVVSFLDPITYTYQVIIV